MTQSTSRRFWPFEYFGAGLRNKTVSLLILSTIFQTLLLLCEGKAGEFQNEWVVEIRGGIDVANEVAVTHGFINQGLVISGLNFYSFSHPKLRKRSLDSNSHHHLKLISHPQVQWAEQQRAKRRVKRDLMFDPNVGPNDPKWSEMWYLLPQTRPNMHVTEAWAAGYTGKKVTVTILDDGIELTHPDLAANYDPLSSSDINSGDSDPSPRLNPTNENRHGTRCAGEVAAVANNGVCATGIAFNASIGGVRMLDGQVTDKVEALSIGFSPNHVDIYSASWGPDDDGRTVDGPAVTARAAFAHGIKEGRQGKGSIFVWASGNGGRHMDNCNCDGYTDSIYTLSISSCTMRGSVPWYSESCSSTLASTYSSGTSGDKQIVTTDLRQGCTSSHTGTSASAPLAAGICALALEANPELSWRDMQHLVVRTASAEGLSQDSFVMNGKGRLVSHAFGYGLMNAYEMVMQAKDWVMVPQQRICMKSVISPTETPRIFTSDKMLVVHVSVLDCDGGAVMVDRLEHVQAQLSLRNERRGDLEIYLTSPQGTKSQLLGRRRNDMSGMGFDEWAFMTTHSWDESPKGRWTLEIRDNNARSVTGTLFHFNLILYGTSDLDWPAVETTSSTTTTSSVAEKTSTKEPVSESKQKPAPTTTTKSSIAETTGGCVIPSHKTNGCIVCDQNSVLEPVNRKCANSCAVEHYVARERVIPDAGVRLRPISEKGGNPEDIQWEEHAAEEKFESGKSHYDGFVCRACAHLCYSCVGRNPEDCNQCVAGATMSTDNVCQLATAIPGSTTFPASYFYGTTRQMQILMFIAFVVFFSCVVAVTICMVTRNRGRCMDQNNHQYQYVSNGDGRVYVNGVDEYYDEDQYPDKTSLDELDNDSFAMTAVPNGNAHSNGSLSSPFLSGRDKEGRS